MTENKIYNQDIAAENLNLKPFREFLSYVKPHTFKMIISIVLIAITAFIEILNPIIIMISIDDVINNTDITLGVYEEYSDVTGINYGNKFYSTVSHNYREPDSEVRLLKIEEDYFFVPNNIVVPEKLKLEVSDGMYYLRTDKKAVLLNIADANFVNSIISQSRLNLLYMLILFSVLLLFRFILGYLNTLIRNSVGQKIVYNLRTKVFRHILSMDVSYFEKNPIGRLVTRTTNDIKNIHLMYTNVLLNGLKDLVIIIGIIITMFALNYKLALITVCLLPILILALVLYRMYSMRVQRKLKVKLAVINSRLSEYISGMKLIQVFTAEKEYYDDFVKINKEYKTLEKKRVTLNSLFSPFFLFLTGVAPVIILLYSVDKIMAGTLEIGLVVAFIKYSSDYYRPLNEFSSRFSVMQSAMASMERVIIVLNTENDIVNSPRAKNIKSITKGINFDNVYFKYDKKEGADYILKDINIDIPKGSNLALVGYTGSGKTTIISLISRFYDVDKGSIKIDDTDIRNIDLLSLRSMIGVVLQDVFLFSDTILENIRLYDETISLEDVKRAAELVNADKIINKLDGGYNYVLKEDGKELSEGERQLISFARAIAHKPKILILDEATSSIDSETEALIQQAIERIKQNFTLIVIAHRLSTIKSADNIVVLSEGKIVEAGRHDELMNKDGLYKKLYMLL